MGIISRLRRPKVRVKIVSDGTLAGTHVIDEEGNELDGVMSVDWEGPEGDAPAKAVIYLRDVELEAEGEVIEVKVDPAPDEIDDGGRVVEVPRQALPS